MDGWRIFSPIPSEGWADTKRIMRILAEAKGTIKVIGEASPLPSLSDGLLEGNVAVSTGSISLSSRVWSETIPAVYTRLAARTIWFGPAYNFTISQVAFLANAYKV